MKFQIIAGPITLHLLVAVLLAASWCQVSYGLIVQEVGRCRATYRRSITVDGANFVRTVSFSGTSSVPDRGAITRKQNTALTSYSSDQRGSQGNNDDNVLYSFGAEVVPEGQRPVNEYLDMKQAPLFGWGSNEVGLKGLLIRLGVVYSVAFLALGFPIAGATYTSDGYLLQKIASANVGTLGLVLIVLIRIYSGWGYIGSRLQSKVIEYEETGWYDGNFEPKTEAEMKRDQFLYRSDVQPAVDRLKLLTLVAAGLWVASCVGFSEANKMKPKFNAYDPQVLNQVVKDESFANAAAAASNDGRPTYCDSRYYRAIANGGQGCGN